MGVINIFMCRFLGFQSSRPCEIHYSLHDAENALVKQSKKHPDGWGVGYYVDKELYLMKSARAASVILIFHILPRESFQKQSFVM